jgi:hypothetical protein
VTWRATATAVVRQPPGQLTGVADVAGVLGVACTVPGRVEPGWPEPDGCCVVVAHEVAVTAASAVAAQNEIRGILGRCMMSSRCAAASSTPAGHVAPTVTQGRPTSLREIRGR